tara:strand:+ start:641 stop:1519 length:879 start_codon:yes stop_codon:yes gene_type:complete
MTVSRPKKKRVVVSLVTFNSDIGVLRNTLLSLVREIQTVESLGSIGFDRVFIVENFSNLYYREKLHGLVSNFRRNYEAITFTLITLDENIGFGQAHNLAIFQSQSDYHLILNPDLLIQYGSLNNALSNFEKNSNIGLIAPMIIDEHGSPARSHYNDLSIFDIFLRSLAPQSIQNLFSRRINKINSVPVDETINSGEKAVFSGCAMLCRSSALRQVGGFSKDYFLYFEDYDLSLRILQHHKAIVDSNFKVIHYGGETTKKGHRHWIYFLRSLVTFYFFSARKKTERLYSKNDL